jgi:RNA polymerase sigma factor (sigma-70 family)
VSKKDYSDKEIIEGCIQGRHLFQELLYRRYFAFAVSVCIRYNPNRDDAIEVLNDSFMKVFDNIKKYDLEKPFRSWFRRILINTSLDRYRENKKFQIHAEFDVSELEIAGESQTYTRMDAEEILSLLSSLPSLYRIIFNLYEVEGYSHDEIAGMLGIAPGTSRSHLSRAKAMVRKMYEQKKKKPYNEAI